MDSRRVWLCPAGLSLQAVGEAREEGVPHGAQASGAGGGQTDGWVDRAGCRHVRRGQGSSKGGCRVWSSGPGGGDALSHHCGW